MKSFLLVLCILLMFLLPAYSQLSSKVDTTVMDDQYNETNTSSIQDQGKDIRLTDLVKEGDPVPSPLTFNTQFERIVIARMTFGTDLLKGLQDAVKKEKIRSAVILTGIGSLTSYHLHSINKTTLPPDNIFYKDEGPYDLLTVTGYVINGRVHAHITVTNDEQAIGGHLEPDTKVYKFGIVTLGVLDDYVDLNRLDDTNWR
ncbi:MAG: DNA-binding protein [Calditrichaceae bacterium]